MHRTEAERDFAQSAPEIQVSELRRSAQRWRTVLRVAFASVAVLVWAAFAEETWHEYRLTRSAVAQRDANLAVAVEHYVIRVVRLSNAVHRYIGRLVRAAHGNAELEEVLRDRLRVNEVFDELALCFPDGRVLSAALERPVMDRQICARWLAEAGSADELRMLRPVQEGSGLKLPLVLPVADGVGGRMALVVALSPAEKVLGIMQSTVLSEDTTVVVSSSPDHVLAAWRSAAGHLKQLTGFAPLSDLLRASGGEVAIGGRKHFVSARQVPPAAVDVRVATASDDALSAFYARRTRFFVACLLVTAGLAALYLLLARMHVQSLRRTLALSRARAELQALNASLDEQVQQRTAQLEQAYRDLETFSYAVAHDVRAPLGRIIGFADALRSAVAANGIDKHVHFLDRIRTNAAHMDQLTSNLLELGRLTRAPLVRKEVDLSAMAERVIRQLRESEPGRKVHVEIERGLAVRGDSALLHQVLENLLSNAWKFTSREGEARITFCRERSGGAETVFRVSDNGVGFDGEQASQLFQPFRRAHDDAEFPGNGVGLAAVQRIVTLHGGAAWCDARPGCGANFYFSIPAKHEASHAAGALSGPAAPAPERP